ncbi:MAG: hypothetical protein E7Z87_04590 [Cyanobacteria bacterium SIG26]|nr:hypothetical protein [Cyanobacteria bacterium SIG26]
MKISNEVKQLNIKQQSATKNVARNNNAKQNSTPTFTNAGTLLLNFLDTSPAWGACAVDCGFMVIPRTITDFTRGADVGVETMRREGTGATNHASVGLYGAAAGAAVGSAINNLYNLGNGNGVKANAIYADSETLDLHGKIYHNKLKASVNTPNANPLREYLAETLKQYEALSGTEHSKWVKIEDHNVINNVVDILENEIKANSGKISKEAFQKAKNELVSAFGVENNLRIIAGEGEKLHTSRYTVENLIDNTYKLGKVFSTDKVKAAFANAAEYTENAFVKAYKSMSLKRSLIGVGIASVIGASAQPINMYLTKLKTGSNKFVGGGEEDKSVGFKARKAAVTGVFATGVLASIGNPIKLLKNPSELLNKIQFKGFSPTINQFKFIYGLTIASRFLAARNDNELKEASIKDFLGFANWLILGNFVQKLVAQGLDKSLVKRDGEGVMNWISNSSLRTREELLHTALGKDVIKDGKALNFKEMLAALPKNHAVRKQLRALTFAQLAGYAYSGLVLGVGIPTLNKHLTNKREAKRKAMEATKQAQNQVQDPMLKPTNIAFLNQKNFTGNKLLAQ